jgi:3-oxoacyl-[acyl-carrier-protein] synthase II
MNERAVITGVSCISCFGLGPLAFVENLRAGRSGIAPITAFDTTNCHSHHASSIRGFDAAAFIPPLKLRRVDAVGRIALAGARLLFEAAAYPPPAEGTGHSGVGIALGTYTAGLDSVVEYLTGLTERGPTGVPAILFSNTVANAPASLCAIELGLRGPNVTFNQREASSLAALAFSVGAIRDGRATAMIAGGADSVEETFFKGHDRFRALSPMQATTGPESARPFDRRRNGFVLGEGGFLVLLESREAASARGATVYGEILGIGVTSSPAPRNGWPVVADGLARAMRMALSEARLEANEVAAIVGTSNGSPRLDLVEAQAIADVFGPRAVAVASIKGAIGESSAAAVGGLIAGLYAIRDRALIPTVGFGEADPQLCVRVSGALQLIAGDVFLVNSVASGGSIYSAVVQTAAPSA